MHEGRQNCLPSFLSPKNKNKKCWKCTHPEAIQDVDEFVSTNLEKHSITCSPVDPLQWMGAVRIRVQTVKKYTQLFTSQDINGLEWCGLLMDYCDVFISCLVSHSDGTHSLQRIHWWESDVILNWWWIYSRHTSEAMSHINVSKLTAE